MWTSTGSYLCPVRKNPHSRAGYQWDLEQGSGWPAVCPSWRDSNCPGSDTTPPPRRGRRGTAQGASIHLHPVSKASPNRARGWAWVSAPNNGNNCPCLVKLSAFGGSLAVCPPVLGMQLGAELSLSPGDSAEVCGCPRKKPLWLCCPFPPLGFCRPLPTWGSNLPSRPSYHTPFPNQDPWAGDCL